MSEFYHKVALIWLFLMLVYFIIFIIGTSMALERLFKALIKRLVNIIKQKKN